MYIYIIMNRRLQRPLQRPLQRQLSARERARDEEIAARKEKQNLTIIANAQRARSARLRTSASDPGIRNRLSNTSDYTLRELLEHLVRQNVTIIDALALAQQNKGWITYADTPSLNDVGSYVAGAGAVVGSMFGGGKRHTGKRRTGKRHTGKRCRTGKRHTGKRHTGKRRTGKRRTGNRHTGKR